MSQMTKMASQRKILIFAALHILSIILFLIGFFPIKKILSSRSSYNDIPEIWKNENLELPRNFFDRPQYDRMVFMVIDAWRDDFLFKQTFAENMKYTANLIARRNGHVFNSKANAPTVTLPRLKALLTGNIPGFSDVITNVNTKALEDDNWVDQLVNHNKTVVFYGDDTWLKLLPNHFTRSEGTTSFFVTDYIEVDANVTRNLHREMDFSFEWDVMILHYLGLDHIGHLEGPYSQLLPPKLVEMDRAVQNVYIGLMDKDKRDKKKSVVVVCGDHGMSDLGSHGGATPREVHTPLLILPVLQKEVKDTEPKEPVEPKNVSQIDIAPTISALLDLPIPVNNLGKLILPAFDIPLQSQINWLFYNVHQVIKVFRQYSTSSFETDSCFPYYNEGLRLHKRLQNGVKGDEKNVLLSYSNAITCMKDKVTEKLINYDMYLIIFSILLFAAGGVGILQELSGHELNPTLPFAGLIISAILGLFLHLILCTGSCSTSILCTNPIYLVVAVGVILWYLSYVYRFQRLHVRTIFGAICSMSFSEGLMLCAVAIQCLSLGSSSFVEEEHQIWYFFISSWCVLILYRNASKYLSSVVSETGSRFLRLDGTSWLLVLILFRLARKWNQTGDKWAHLPDIGDFINKSENKWLLTVLVVAALIIIAIIHFKNLNTVQYLIFICALSAVFIYRLSSRNLLYNGITPIDGTSVAKLTYVLLLLLLIVTVCSSRKKDSTSFIDDLSMCFVACWAVIVSLLLRPHNVFLFAMISAIELIVSKIKLSNNVQVTIIYYWFAATSFFLQGNSGSLSTIDVSAGYVGLSSYNSVIVGIQLACGTYAFYIYWLLSMFRMIVKINRQSWQQIKEGLSQMSGSLIVYKSLVVLFYGTILTAHRYHLFIWTVFSPKMLYESMSSVILTLFIVLVSTNVAVIDRTECGNFAS